MKSFKDYINEAKRPSAKQRAKVLDRPIMANNLLIILRSKGINISSFDELQNHPYAHQAIPVLAKVLDGLKDMTKEELKELEIVLAKKLKVKMR
jgi:hypothetical protein